jgi:CBS domain-containing membrane protein
MAPVGASAVLLFAVPASPLAQPWPVLGGNLLSALAGVAVVQIIDTPLMAAAVAVGGAIAVMSLLRCLHPPGGAVALTAVLTSAGPEFAVVPVLLESAALVAAAMIFNRLSGIPYPHRPHQTQHPHVPGHAVVLQPADFEQVLADYGETLDITARDLEMLYIELAGRAEMRRKGML